MPFRVTFDLEDKDLRYFRTQMKQAQEAASKLGDEEVLASAADMIEEIKTAKVPMFVAVRVAKLSALIDMVRDEDWGLADKERANVISALAYFADPQDMINVHGINLPHSPANRLAATIVQADSNPASSVPMGTVL